MVTCGAARHLASTEEAPVAWWSNLRLSAKLTFLGFVFLTAFLAFAWRTHATIEELKVNGPIYDEVIEGKDIIADVLPPPEYIVESYLLVLQLLDETDATRRDRLVARSAQTRAEYDDRHAYWVGRQEDLRPEMRGYLLDESYRPAKEFFELRDKEFMPLVRDGKLSEARALATGRLRELYDQQREAVDKVVALATRDNLATEAEAKDRLKAAGTGLFVLGAIVVAIVLFMAWIMGRLASALAHRLSVATEAATRVADGDLTRTFDSTGSDEAGRLLGALRSMTHGLTNLVARVKKGSIELLSTATELSSTSMQQENTINAFGASTTEIAAAVKEISATSDALLGTMEQVNHLASTTASSAQSGRDALGGMDGTMQKLAAATASISAKLSTIREKSADVGAVVTTITKVADQTNLLSVNAAIEAEKAGEHGLGFLVLAREIRRLADQTAVATLDIERIVKETQAAVAAGVMEMDKFSDEVRQGVAGVGVVGTQLSEIIGSVEDLSQRFDEVAEGMRRQAQGAKQINDAMVNLADGAKQTGASVREVNTAAQHLREAVNGLREEISRFKTAT
jgi:methyl-accepting chemotaxis protein WspA